MCRINSHNTHELLSCRSSFVRVCACVCLCVKELQFRPPNHKFQPKSSNYFLCCILPAFLSPYLLHFPTLQTYFQPTFARRTNGHTVGSFQDSEFSVSLCNNKNTVTLNTPPASYNPPSSSSVSSVSPQMVYIPTAVA